MGLNINFMRQGYDKQKRQCRTSTCYIQGCKLLIAVQQKQKYTTCLHSLWNWVYDTKIITVRNKSTSDVMYVEIKARETKPFLEINLDK